MRKFTTMMVATGALLAVASTVEAGGRQRALAFRQQAFRQQAFQRSVFRQAVYSPGCATLAAPVYASAFAPSCAPVYPIQNVQAYDDPAFNIDCGSSALYGVGSAFAPRRQFFTPSRNRFFSPSRNRFFTTSRNQFFTPSRNRFLIGGGSGLRLGRLINLAF